MNVSGPLTINLQRALYVDFLPPLVSLKLGLYIPNVESSENIDFNTFFTPFNANLWLTMIITSFVLTITKLLIQYEHAKISITNCVSCFWTSFISYLGGKPTKSPVDSKESYKTVILEGTKTHHHAPPCTTDAPPMHHRTKTHHQLNLHFKTFGLGWWWV